MSAPARPSRACSAAAPQAPQVLKALTQDYLNKKRLLRNAGI